MVPSNYHTHTTFGDGRDTPEEMVLEAIRLGCPELGFSEHAHTAFDEHYCMNAETAVAYREEIRRLQEKYRDRIVIRLGVEQDVFSDTTTEGYEYVIGSVHYIYKGGEYLPIDLSEERQCADVARYYGGDFYAYIEDYYELVGRIYEITKCDIVGHFDLVTKYNEDGHLFDIKNPRYIAAQDSALEKLMTTPVAFETNTGAVARGYRKTPYPDERVLSIWKSAGVKIVCNSDCHDKRFLLLGL